MAFKPVTPKEEVEDIHVLAGTGSKSLQKATVEEKLRAVSLIDEQLLERKEEHGDKLVVMSGMAEGFDKALALRALFHGIKLWCAIPNKGYARYYWERNSLTGTNQIQTFNYIVTNAWRVTYVMEDVHGITNSLYLRGRHSNFVRNDFMVEKGDEFLVWSPTSSGTRDCFESIQRAIKPFYVFE